MPAKITSSKGRVSVFGGAAFSYLVEKVLFFACAGIRIGQTFTYDRKNCLIGKLKRSYRRIKIVL